MLEADSKSDPRKDMRFGPNLGRRGKLGLPRSYSLNRAGWNWNGIRRVIDHLRLRRFREQTERIRLGQVFAALGGRRQPRNCAEQ